MSAAPDDPGKVVKLKTKTKPKPRRVDGIHVWSDLLIRGRDGPRDCIANVALVLRSDPAFVGKFSFNLFRQRPVVGSMPWHTTDHLRDWVDQDSLALAEWVQLRGLVAKPGTCEQAVRIVAHEHETHPLRDRLDSLEWDGVERLDGWLTDYLGVRKSDYSTTVGRKWMLQAVARIKEPGCKADYTLILEGIQGPGKSTVCEILSLDPEYFADGIADLGTKDSKEDLPGKWIIELGELSEVRRGAVERVKAFLTRKTDHYRPSYGRCAQDFPRQCVFIGSTNSTAYLTDPTGNRRFWPVTVGMLDLDSLRLDVEQLWAEAVHFYRKGERRWLDPKMEEMAGEEQEQRTEVDPWHELVLNAATAIHERQLVTTYDHQGIPHSAVPKATLATANAIMDVMNVPIERRGKAQETRIGIVMRKAGWTRGEARDAKPPAPRRWYVPPEVGQND